MVVQVDPYLRLGHLGRMTTTRMMNRALLAAESRLRRMSISCDCHLLSRYDVVIVLELKDLLSTPSCARRGLVQSKARRQRCCRSLDR